MVHLAQSRTSKNIRLNYDESINSKWKGKRAKINKALLLCNFKKLHLCMYKQFLENKLLKVSNTNKYNKTSYLYGLIK